MKNIINHLEELGKKLYDGFPRLFLYATASAPGDLIRLNPRLLK